MSKLLVTDEKYGQRFIFAGNTKQSQEKAAALVVRERLADGAYDDKVASQAQAALSKGRAFGFLDSRAEAEYEGYVLEEIEYP
jgi:hypothetical protein